MRYQKKGCIQNSCTNCIHDGTIKIRKIPREATNIRDLPISQYLFASAEVVFINHSHIWRIYFKAIGYSRRPSTSPYNNKSRQL